MHYFVTGGAGFIGSQMTDYLLTKGNKVTVFDNLSTGSLEFIDAKKNNNKNLKFIEGDLLDTKFLLSSMDSEIDFVYHFAANADVRFGLQNPTKDLEQNTIATSNLLEAMREKNIKKICFSSTGSVYGEPETFPTSEDSSFPIQTSLYGASKVACEGLISSYCEGFGFKGLIFRFVSILGERYTHGHVYDFVKKLITNSEEITILGDGNQTKSYLNVQDCIRAMYLAEKNIGEKVTIYNLGNPETIKVKNSLDIICKVLNVNPVVKTTGGIRGWIGDSPLIELEIKKIKNLGWYPEITIENSIIETVNWLTNNKWVFENK